MQPSPRLKRACECHGGSGRETGRAGNRDTWSLEAHGVGHSAARVESAAHDIGEERCAVVALQAIADVSVDCVLGEHPGRAEGGCNDEVDPACVVGRVHGLRIPDSAWTMAFDDGIGPTALVADAKFAERADFGKDSAERSRGSRMPSGYVRAIVRIH